MLFEVGAHPRLLHTVCARLQIHVQAHPQDVTRLLPPSDRQASAHTIIATYYDTPPATITPILADVLTRHASSICQAQLLQQYHSNKTATEERQINAALLIESFHQIGPRFGALEMPKG